MTDATDVLDTTETGLSWFWHNLWWLLLAAFALILVFDIIRYSRNRTQPFITLSILNGIYAVAIRNKFTKTMAVVLILITATLVVMQIFYPETLQSIFDAFGALYATISSWFPSDDTTPE